MKRFKVFPVHMLSVAFLWLLMSLATPLSAQILDSENKLTVILSDGTAVTLYGKATSLSDTKSNEYYYLPVNPRLSQRSDGTPEFLFMKFTTEESDDNGGVSGALMHFLMEWGLTPEQESELKDILEREHEAKLNGVVNVTPDGEESFKIISGTLGDKGMTETLITSDQASVLPGSKVATAARLDKRGAQLLAASFEKARSISDVSIELGFQYTLRFPAARGRAVIDWSKVHEISEKVQAEYDRKVTGSETKEASFAYIFKYSSTKPTYAFSYDEMHEMYDRMREEKAITVEFDANQDDERVDKVREAFFEYFLNHLTEKANPQQMVPPSKQEQEINPDIKHGSHYTFNVQKTKEMSQTGRQEFNLNYRLAIKRSMNITGNLASWYDAVRDNPRCVTSVNLNDPFFRDRNINFILDLDAKDMFEDEVNYVTVMVKKERSSGRAFEDQLTIDAAHLKEKGVKASMTYAMGEDKNATAFSYAMQWSLRGGKLFPPQPKWQRGNWEGVTLAPPVKPRYVELEANLDRLKELKITRVTAQVLYTKFGKLQKTNIHISPAQGKPLVEKLIFLDQYAEGFAYRFVFNHEEEGKLALDWSEKITDDYLYVTIPEQLNDKKSGLFKRAKSNGKRRFQNIDLTKEESLKGLEIFKGLVDAITN